MAGPVHLVVGADGMLGGALSRRLLDLPEPVIGMTRRRDSVSPSRPYLDLGEGAGEWTCPWPVSVAFLCAGITDLDACRDDPEGTARVNVKGVAALAASLAALGAFVIYLSTNHVFNGNAARQPADAPYSPITEYGRQKAEAEGLLLALGDRACVVRFSKILAPGAPLLAKWVEALRADRVIQPFSDAVMAPVPLSFAVEALLAIAAKRTPGVFQVSAPDDITYAEAASSIARKLGVSDALVQPMRSDASEPFPSHTTLDTARLRGELGMEPPAAEAALDSTLGL